MKLLKLIEEKTGNGTWVSLTRFVASATFVVLSIGFIVLSYKGRTTWQTFLSYPAGVAIAFAPQLFLRLMDKMKDLIKAYKGQGDSNDLSMDA